MDVKKKDCEHFCLDHPMLGIIPECGCTTHDVGKSEQDEFNKIAAGMDEVNDKMAAEIERAAPFCHMRKMFFDQSDSTDGYYEEWWECSVCGHTKDL